MRTQWNQAAVLFVCTGLAVILTACQTPGRVVSKEASAVCPTCEAVTRTAPIRGLTYTTCVCPSCRKASTLEPALEYSLRAYMGDSLGETVQVCDRCRSVVAACPVCRAEGAR
jgi:hypothetical protein